VAASTSAIELSPDMHAHPSINLFSFVSVLAQSGAPARCNRSRQTQRNANKWEISVTSDSRTMEANKAITGRFTEQFKNRHIVDSVDELFSPRASLHLPLGEQAVGPDGQKDLGRTIFSAFPDVHVTIDNVTADGNFVAERHTARGTHNGEFMGIPATGKKIHWTENHFYRLEGGMIQEMWSEWSYQILMDQLTKK